MSEHTLMQPRACGFGSDGTVPRVLRYALSVAVALVFASLSLPSRGGAEEDPFVGIEEMVVTGEGESRLPIYDGISAIAFDAEHLEAIGAQDISDIAAFTPNLEIRTPFAASSPTLFIRGVGLRDFSASSSSSVAVYNDEIYMNAPAGQLAQLFDVKNIEVLRGPQATQYGRNASAGTLRVVTRKPTGTPGATASVAYGRFNQLDMNVAVENVLIPDHLSMRTAAKWSTRKGTTKNRCADSDYLDRPRLQDIDGRTDAGRQAALVFQVNTACYSASNVRQDIAPPGAGWVRGETGYVKEWVNDTRNWAARSIFRFEHPFLDMDWQLNLHGGQNRGDARQFQVIAASQGMLEQLPTPAPGGLDIDEYSDADNRVFTGRRRFVQIRSPFIGNPYEGDYDNVEKEKVDLFGASLTGEMTFGDYKVTSITGYEWNKRDTKVNFDGNPAPSLHVEFNNSSYQLTQELRLDFENEGDLTWQLGGMFLYDAINAENYFPFSLIAVAIDQRYSFLTRYATVWGEVSWEPAETFTLEAGIRINYEEKELDLSRQSVLPIPGSDLRLPVVFPVSSPHAGEQIPRRTAGSAAKEYGWAGKIVATWRPDTDVDFYLSYVRGWKGPHINSVVVNPGPDGTESGALSKPAESETIDSIETGIKARLFNGRVAFSSAFFYYDYQDLQTYALRNEVGATPAPELINADDADIFGVEMELDMRPFEGWAHPTFEMLWIRLSFAWLDAYYTDFVNVFPFQSAGDELVTRVASEDFTGNRLINAPEFSFIGFVAWPIDKDWGVVIPRVDWSYKDEVFFSAANSPLVAQDALWLVNMRVTYRSPNELFELAGWIENLTDQAYTEDVFNLARLRESILHAIGDPRTYGVTLTLKY